MNLRTIRWTLAIAAVYFVAAKFGFRMALTAEQVTLVWPPTGLSLAALVLAGIDMWPGVFVGAFLANVTTHEPLAVAVTIASGNTLEAVAAAWLLARYAGVGQTIDRLRHALGLVVSGALISTTLSATIGVTSLCLGGVQPWAAYHQLWWTWWLGDAAGDLLIAPALLTWRVWPRQWRWRDVAEAMLLVTGLAVTSISVFGARHSGAEPLPLSYTVFPFVVGAAIRFGVAGAATANLLTAGVAVWGTMHGLGSFASAEGDERLMLLQIFMGVMAGTGFLLGALVSERDASTHRQDVQAAVTEVLASAATTKEATWRILEIIGTRLGWDVGLLWSVDHAAELLQCVEYWCPVPAGFPQFERTCRTRPFAINAGLPGTVWAFGEPQWIADVSRDDSFLRVSAAADRLRGALAFPITNGRAVLGVIELLSRAARRPDDEALDMLADIGAEIGQFLTRKRVEEEIQESEARKAGMLEAALDCIITIDHAGRILEFNPAAERTFGYRRAEVLGREMAELIIPEPQRTAHRQGLARYLEAGDPGILGRRLEVTAMRADGTKFPVELSVTRVPSAGPPVFTGFLRDITEGKRVAEQLAFRATHDGLTRVLNRSAFTERLTEAAARAGDERDYVFAVLFVDLDQFKAINDHLGHVVGDRLLAATSLRLRAAVRPGDTVARLGGDEFAILLEKITATDVAVVVGRVTAALDKPFNLDGRRVRVTASIGTALSSATRYKPDDMLRAADEAMYRVKSSARA